MGWKKEFVLEKEEVYGRKQLSFLVELKYLVTLEVPI